MLLSSSRVRPMDDFNQRSGGMPLGRGRSLMRLVNAVDDDDDDFFEDERLLLASLPQLFVDADRGLLLADFGWLSLGPLSLSRGDFDFARFGATDVSVLRPCIVVGDEERDRFVA